MSKYDPLWKHIVSLKQQKSEISFSEIKSILGFDIDHSFLNYKKELLAYGYEIEKISLKDRKIKIKTVH